MPNPTAKSLILDLLSTLRGHSMPVRALVAAGSFFAIEENNVRVSLARLCGAEVIERDERGLYRLGQSAQAVERQITSWRRLEERVCDWDGGWVAVQGPTATRGAAGRRSAQALKFLGFRPLAPELMLRPDNLIGGVASVRSELQALHLSDSTAVFGVRDLDADREELARSLWDTSGLLADYATHHARITASQARFSHLTNEQSMVESFLLGGAVVRQLVLDPLLPEAIVANDPRKQLVAAMRDYDRIGRAAWGDFLEAHGVVHLQAPADLRVGHAESRFHHWTETGVTA